MDRTTLLQGKSISVRDFRCTAAPGDKPFAERFACHSISYVRKGSFGCHSRGRFFELVAGSILVGHPGDEYVCTHDHVCGDECLSFFLAPELVEAIGDRAEAWRIGSAPPLPELMVLGELAQAAACGRSDIGLDEVGQVFASRFVEVVSGRPHQPVTTRGGNGALDRCPFAPADRSGAGRRSGRHQPVPFPAAVLERAGGYPASISGALAAASCGAPVGRQ
jgi:hypothetical protein